MRYNEIIEAATFKSTLNKILLECSEICSIYKQSGNILLRGMKSQTKSILSLSARTDRKPKDSPETFHNALNRWFEKHGYIANRSNGVFCSSNINILRPYYNRDKYGAMTTGLYMIFPKNGFHFTWLEDCSDLYLARGNFYSNMKKIYQRFDDDDWHDDTEYNTVLSQYPIEIQDDAIDQLMDRYKPRKDDITAAIKSGNEIIIVGDYYAVAVNSTYGMIIKETILGKGE